jgi:hypothetical protein
MKYLAFCTLIFILSCNNKSAEEKTQVNNTDSVNKTSPNTSSNSTVTTVDGIVGEWAIRRGISWRIQRMNCIL